MSNFNSEFPQVPPGQQVVSPNKWPVIGEREPASSNAAWELTIDGLVEKPLTFSLPQLQQLPQTEMLLDIHCVTRWSKLDVPISGVLLSDLLPLVGVKPEAKFLSFLARSDQNHSTSLPIDTAIEHRCLITLFAEGTPLEIGHGGPIRNMVPGKYFYKSVKWLQRIEVLAEDRLGYWEADAGYHNEADPWREQRYMSSTIDRRTAAKLIQSKDFSDRDLMGIDASGRNLDGLNANGALLRDASFNDCSLVGADFSNANLSNSRFVAADLTNAIFVGTDVEGADFSGANLSGVDLSQCSLIGASFVSRDDRSDGANLKTTTFSPAQLDSLSEIQRDYVRECQR